LNPDHYSERGGNSLNILAYSVSAYSVTKDVKYKKLFWDLAMNYGYLNNAFNGKIDYPEEDNHSDNELMFQGYHILYYALQRLKSSKVQYSEEMKSDIEEMVDALKPSIERTYSIVQGELSPLWLGIYAGTAGMKISEEQIASATWTLRHWALDLIEWPVDNTPRWDITPSPFYSRDSTDPLMRQIVPPQQRQTNKWNSDPFEYAGGSGWGEEYPAIWRLPYFLMAYNGLITTA